MLTLSKMNRHHAGWRWNRDHEEARFYRLVITTPDGRVTVTFESTEPRIVLRVDTIDHVERIESSRDGSKWDLRFVRTPDGSSRFDA